MATVSSSVAENGQIVQAVHAGVNYAFASYKSTGNKTPFSRSVSDAVVMFNLPRNARIISAWLGGNCQDGNCGFSLGDPGDTARHGTASISATSRGANPFADVAQGYVYSISDDQNSYPVTLNLQNTTSVSGSMSVHVGLLWVKK